MARVTVFQGGSIQPEAPNVTPFRAGDFGPGIGAGVERLGESLGQVAKTVNDVQDIDAHIEANKLSVAYNSLATTISERVRSTLGEGAEAAADKGFADLQKGQDELLSKASPRARTLVQTEFAKRTTDYRDQWWNHGFEEKKSAFDTSAQAANDHDLDAALKSSTDADAQPYLAKIKERNQQRASFFGLGSDWTDGENAKAVSSFYKGRAASLGATSAYGAIQYAMEHRGDLSAADFDSIVHSYEDEAYQERAASMYYGTPLGSDPALPKDTPVTPDGQPAPTKTADPKMVFAGLIIPNEGTKLVEHDTNGAPVKYGINQKANPDVDVANLTQPQAEKLFVDRYWKPSGADKLPPALAVVHADTYYLNQKEATKILKESGGDVQKYIELRNNFLAELHAKDPAKYPDYTSRNERVEKYAAAVGGDGTPFSFSGKIGPKTAMEPIVSEIMARTDIPLRLKTALISLAREDRNNQREDLKIKEDDARDTLITATTKLGDNFTSIKQLPQDALANASPETVASLTDLAKTNRYKHNDEVLRPLVTTMEVTDPQHFMSADFITELMRKGASPSLIGQVKTEQAHIAKRQMNRKPDVISSGELWKLAKPAFEASGVFLEGTPGKKRNAAQTQADAAAQQQAAVFLHTEATEWAINNPGKKPTEETMRQWIGAALLKTKSGSRLFQASDADIVHSMSDQVRAQILRQLRRGGDTAQGTELIAHVAQAYRNIRALYGASGSTITMGPDMVMSGIESETQALQDQLDDSGGLGGQ